MVSVAAGVGCIDVAGIPCEPVCSCPHCHHVCRLKLVGADRGWFCFGALHVVLCMSLSYLICMSCWALYYLHTRHTAACATGSFSVVAVWLCLCLICLLGIP